MWVIEKSVNFIKMAHTMKFVYLSGRYDKFFVCVEAGQVRKTVYICQINIFCIHSIMCGKQGIYLLNFNGNLGIKVFEKFGFQKNTILIFISLSSTETQYSWSCGYANYSQNLDMINRHLPYYMKTTNRSFENTIMEMIKDAPIIWMCDVIVFDIGSNWNYLCWIYADWIYDSWYFNNKMSTYHIILTFERECH